MRAWIVHAALASVLALAFGLPSVAVAAGPTPTPTPAPPKSQAPAAPANSQPAPAAKPTPTDVPTSVPMKAPAPAAPAPANPQPAPPAGSRPQANSQPAPAAKPTSTEVPTSVPMSTPVPQTKPAPAPAQQQPAPAPAPQNAAPAPAPPPPAPAEDKPTPRPATPTPAPTEVPLGAVHGRVFQDSDGNAAADPGEGWLADIDIVLTTPRGSQQTAQTAADGTFGFEDLPAGSYHLQVQPPSDRVATTGAGVDLDVSATADPQVWFGLSAPRPADATDPDPTAQDQPTADEIAAEAASESGDSDQEQLMAFTAVSSLPLRFAEGRDLMQQVTRRALADGLVWLGIPFRSQIDGGLFQYVNCGPASLTMVLAGFGLEVGPSQVRDYLNQLIDNYNTDLGTSLDVLSRIGREAGLTPMDLYSDGGGYRYWSTDAVRWHVQQGHPVITLVKYRKLPGHGTSLSEFDHYIVISGLTPNGFIYNDAAFASTLGYGLEISDVELEVAWDNSSIPRHALALGLSPNQKALSFPEAPRVSTAPRESAVARASRELALADEVDRPQLTLTPQPAVTPVPGVPLITAADRWETESEDIEPLTDPGGPMGLNLDQTNQPALEPEPGPGRAIPTILALVLTTWLLLGTWSMAGRLVRLRLPSPSRALAAVLSLLR